MPKEVGSVAQYSVSLTYHVSFEVKEKYLDDGL